MFKNKILNPIIIFIIGALLGIAAKLLDIYTVLLGDIFSELPIWILLGTLISIYSDTKKKAMINVFLFSIGMLITYYLTADITNSIYGWAFIKGWTIFAFISPLFAYLTWMSKEKGAFPIIIRLGILGVSIFYSLSTANLFDLIINIVLGYFLFFKRINRNKITGRGESRNLRKIEDFIDKQNVCFICSIDKDGYPNVKAMLMPRKKNGLKEFYFSTNTSSMRVKQFQDNPNASIYFYHKGLIRYVGVMLVGKMEVLTDQKTKNLIWKKGDTLFYKKGVTDPDYCVLKFTAISGRYYCDLKTENFEIK